MANSEQHDRDKHGQQDPMGRESQQGESHRDSTHREPMERDPMHEGTTRPGSMQQGAEMRCPMCGAEFRSQTELEQHKKQAHPTK